MTDNGNTATHAMHIFQRGITAFKSGDYHRAIKCFDHALRMLPKDSTALASNLLDSRAAAKEKLNDFKGSLGDAKKVIDLAPENPKGYIRAARLFNKIGRFPASVKMFELAITKLSANPKKDPSAVESLKTELKQVIHRETSQISSDSSSSLPSFKSKPNVLTILPYELLISIITLLDIPTRLRCMGVCLSWRHAILNSPTLWKSLSLTSNNHHKLKAQAQFWLKRLGPDQPLETLIIKVAPSWPPKTTPDLLTFLTSSSSLAISPHRSSKGLRHFGFHIGGLSNTVDQTQRIFSDVISFIYLNRLSLVSVELQVPAAIICPLPLHSFLNQFPNLKRLKLQGERGQSLILRESQDFPRSPSLLRNTVNFALGPPSSSNPGILSHSESEACDIVNPSHSQLESLFVQCSTFAPSEEGPIQLASLKSISIISAAIYAKSPHQPNHYVPAVDFTCLPHLNNLELCRIINSQDQWATVWQSCERLSRVKRLRLEGLPELILHFLELADSSPEWSSQLHADQPYTISIESVLPNLEFLSLSCLESVMCYKFLAVFAHQFTKLESLSVAGLPLDSETEPLLISALEHLPSLANINLSNTHARSRVIDAIKPDRLRHLQLANCTCVTFRSISRLITRNVLFLDITGCQLISTREMIEWLAQRVACLIWREDQNAPRKSIKRLFLD